MKQLPEQTVYWPAVPLQKGQLKFDIDLLEAVKLAIRFRGGFTKESIKLDFVAICPFHRLSSPTERTIPAWRCPAQMPSAAGCSYERGRFSQMLHRDVWGKPLSAGKFTSLAPAASRFYQFVPISAGVSTGNAA